MSEKKVTHNSKEPRQNLSKKMLLMHLDSDITEESLQEKLLDIENISKTSTMHFKRLQIADSSAIPLDQKKR